MISYQIIATATTQIAPERIFAILDDFGRWPRWMPSFDRVRVDLPADQQPGPDYSFRLRGAIVYADMRVIDFTPLSRATSFRISFPPLTGINRCTIHPIDDGRYRIERVDSLDLPDLVAGLIDATQRARFERLAQEFLDALLHTAAEG